jgi:hypothetical protein
MLHWIEFEMGKTMAEVVAMAADASKRPKTGILFVIRHTLGILSPGYWASVPMAFSQWDPGIWLFGPEGVANKRIEEMARQTRSYCFDLKLKMEDMISQLASPMYSYRC